MSVVGTGRTVPVGSSQLHEFTSLKYNQAVLTSIFMMLHANEILCYYFSDQFRAICLKSSLPR